ncbi:transposase domain-containing protein [Mesorhizobium sp. M8A.F.Ca.ET.165.01.1.1]|nr:transposase domain-containing protein [Mesorhizobium sp. M8A.F.Ca.ET.207.01.1.1]TGS39128.1 transposase domain-containing protein [Mesorhizobium sp. M8A.F.Ca.ET.182.01.1.1]TGS77410.1 transposase domain-containing protein [Mesorhizobium sp. M8A.F.Ca.ET.181.01.1.1]TGT36291.1 transposase domain-containing protein [Mesorhizobium sp. M8A.F.Ca.ET.165.01.1.1]
MRPLPAATAAASAGRSSLGHRNYKLSGVDPQSYLADLIARIVACHPQSQINDLLPMRQAAQGRGP